MALKRFLAIGECMVELAPDANGLYRRSFAGDTFNTAYYARRYFGADWAVGYCTAVGDDELSAAMRAFIADQGLETGSIRVVPGGTVGLYMIHLKDGERRFSYWRSQSAATSLADDPQALRRILSASDAVFFSGITLAILPPTSRAAFLSEIAKARRSGKTVAFDPNIRMRLWPDPDEMRAAITQAARLAHIALPSFDDEASAFGDADLDAVAERYGAHGADVVVVKDGARDGLVWAKGRFAAVPVAPVAQVVDATAAGDSFDGAFLASYLQDGDPFAAASLGAGVAAAVVGHRGALIPRDVLPAMARSG